MICDKCKKDFKEVEIQDSHDVPCYLFKGLDRKEKKQQADKFGRHWLCKKCHEEYEEGLRMSLKVLAVKYANKTFGEDTIWKKM